VKNIQLALIFLALVGGLYANERIVIAAFEYPPIYQNEAEKGLSGDIVAEAFRAVDIETEFLFLPVSRMVFAVSDGQAVCGLGGKVLFSDPEISENVTPSAVIQYVLQTFFFDSRRYPDGIEYDTISDMAKYRIGVLEGSGINRFLEGTPGLRIEKNTTHEGSAWQLQLKRIDVWAIVDLTGLMYIHKLFSKESSYYRYTKAYNLGDVSVIFSKKRDPERVYEARFNEGLAIIKKNGTYMKLMEKYYGCLSSINPDVLTSDMREAYQK
jgi:polar amino acid transport system substrate-binding protein